MYESEILNVELDLINDLIELNLQSMICKHGNSHVDYQNLYTVSFLVLLNDPVSLLK